MDIIKILGFLIDKGDDLISKNCLRLHVDDQHIGFDQCNAALRRLCRKKFDAHRLFTQCDSFCVLSPGTEYVIKMRNMSGIFVQSYKNDKNNVLELSLLFYGKDRYKNREKFVRYMEKEITNTNKIRVIRSGEFHCELKVNPTDIRKMTLDNKVKANIISGITEWSQSKEWYRDHQLVHKIGILLYGEPGCGKSAMIRGISSMFNNAPIIMLDPSSISDSIYTIIATRNTFDGVMIVVFEDFDMTFYDRTSDKEKDPEDISKMKENQNLAFQILDGLYSTDNTIYIATTNHIDRLDPAMIRHGRFDIQEELKGFDEHLALKFLNQFGYGKEFYENNIKPNFEFPIQPAKLQSFVLEYRSHELLKSKMDQKKK